LTVQSPWLVPDWPVRPHVRALITTRAGGASRGVYASLNLAEQVGDDAQAVAHNREALQRLLPTEPVWLRQVHGTRVVDAAPGCRGEEADGSVARAPGQRCAVLTADCLPVLLADVEGTVVGVAHAGWRGLAAGVIENAVRAMAVAPEAVVAYLGPAIGPGAYEVGGDVLDAFTAVDPGAVQAFAPAGRGKFLADLYRLARRRLERLGCTRIHGGAYCTYSDAGRFYSYRRDGPTGRMASLVWME
jgi:YfiH family protein